MSKLTKTILLITVVIFLSWWLVNRANEDYWLCQNGEWVKHGNPSTSIPTEPCGEQDSPKAIFVTTPKPNEIVQNPIIIEGQAKGIWFFETTFPIRLLDNNGNQLAVGYVQAQDDWMTENFVTFKGELNYLSEATTTATLILERDNPSGIIGLSDKYEIPLTLSPIEIQVVKVYFNNDQLDPEVLCNKVFPVERNIAKTQAVARAALEELLKGPTTKEKEQGYFTNINDGVVIQSLIIENNVAKVDFNEQLEFQVGGSCRVAAIRAEITETLKQFPTVNEVIISINGRTEDILQP